MSRSPTRPAKRRLQKNWPTRPPMSCGVLACRSRGPGVSRRPAAPPGLSLRGTAPAPSGAQLPVNLEILANRVSCCPRGTGLSTPGTLAGKWLTHLSGACWAVAAPNSTATFTLWEEASRPSAGNSEELRAAVVYCPQPTQESAGGANRCHTQTPWN